MIVQLTSLTVGASEAIFTGTSIDVNTVSTRASIEADVGLTIVEVYMVIEFINVQPQCA